jgi:hypothetical protein
MALTAPERPNPAGGPTPPPGLFQAVRQRMFGHQPEGTPAGQEDPYAVFLGEEGSAAALKLLETTLKASESGREQFERSWWRSLLYIRGRQWIYWDTGAREFRDKRMYKWIPRPVTNITRTAWLTIRSMCAAIRLNITARPMGKATKNVVAADVASQLVQPLYDEHQMKAKVMPTADSWAIILGNAYLYTHWDPHDTTHMEEQSMWGCNLCGQAYTSADIVAAQQKCPGCGAEGSELNETGEMSMQPVGRGKTIAVSPLELRLPMYAQDFDQVDCLVWPVFRPRHKVENEYPPELTARVQWTTSVQQRGLQLYRQLTTLADTVDSGAGVTDAQMGSGPANNVEGTVEQHLWMKPTKQYPEGIYIRFLGETQPIPVLLPGQRPTMPFRRKKDNAPIWPWIHYPFESSPGSLYAEGALGPVCAKNEQINKLDSMAELMIKRMGNPVWTEPKGSEVERLTGDIGLIIRYQQTGQNGKPERIDGLPVNNSIFQLRAMHKEDVQEAVGTQDVLAGGKPPGVEAYSALELLDQRGRARFESLFAMRATALAKWYENALELERTYGPGTRTIAVMGPNQKWAFKNFENAQLDGDVAIIFDDSSSMPRTALGRMAALERGAAMGVIRPSDPEREYALLEEFGLTSMAPALNADINSALQEQDATEEWLAAGAQGPCPLLRYPWQNDLVHIGENRKWMNSDAVRDALKTLPEPVAAMVIETFNEHLMMHQAGAQATAMAQAMMVTPGAGPGGPTSPGSPTSGGSGGGGPQGASPRPGGPGRDGQGVGAGRGMANSRQNSGRDQSTGNRQAN